MDKWTQGHTPMSSPSIYMHKLDKKDVRTNVQNGHMDKWAEWAQGHTPIYMYKLDKNDVQASGQNGQEDRNDVQTRG